MLLLLQITRNKERLNLPRPSDLVKFLRSSFVTRDLIVNCTPDHTVTSKNRSIENDLEALTKVPSRIFAPSFQTVQAEY